jgi:rare lipoprotein A (peptidoglycan hydrolase)
MLSILRALSIFAMAHLFGLGAEAGVATRYGDPGDRYAGGKLACVGRDMLPGELLCAHRTLPCGTRLLVINLERPGQAYCTVKDRGPYAVPTRPWVASIDLSPAMAQAVNLDGSDLVAYVWLKTPPPASPPPASMPTASVTATGQPVF